MKVVVEYISLRRNESIWVIVIEMMCFYIETREAIYKFKKYDFLVLEIN